MPRLDVLGVGVLVVTLVGICNGQAIPVFGLKGDNLGETLREFREKNSREVSVSDSINGSFALRYPVCSGEPMPGKYGDVNYATFALNSDNPPDRGRYQLCVTSGAIAGAKEPSSATIAGVSARNLFFRFADQLLFEISAMISREDFPTLERGLTEKYGKPASSVVEQFQNGYGAKFQGKHMIWISGDAVIEIHERIAGNENPISDISIYQRDEFRIYHRIKPPVVDPAKDL